MSATSSVTPEKIKKLLSSFVVDQRAETARGTTGESGGNSKQCRYDAFLQRVRSFTSLTWFAKPGWLSPPICARYGWENVGPNLLQCVKCKAHISGRLPSVYDSASYDECCASVETSLRNGHRVCCSWAHNPSPISFLNVPLGRSEEETNTFIDRVAAFLPLGAKLPVISDAILEQLDLDLSSLNHLKSLVRTELSSEVLGNDEGAEDSLKAACILALCGWKKRDKACLAEEASCDLCSCNLGLWNFFSTTNPLVSEESDSEEDVVMEEKAESEETATEQNDEMEEVTESDDKLNEDNSQKECNEESSKLSLNESENEQLMNKDVQMKEKEESVAPPSDNKSNKDNSDIEMNEMNTQTDAEHQGMVFGMVEQKNSEQEVSKDGSEEKDNEEQDIKDNEIKVESQVNAAEDNSEEATDNKTSDQRKNGREEESTDGMEENMKEEDERSQQQYNQIEKSTETEQEEMSEQDKIETESLKSETSEQDGDGEVNKIDTIVEKLRQKTLSAVAEENSTASEPNTETQSDSKQESEVEAEAQSENDRNSNGQSNSDMLQIDTSNQSIDYPQSKPMRSSVEEEGLMSENESNSTRDNERMERTRNIPPYQPSDSESEEDNNTREGTPLSSIAYDTKSETESVNETETKSECVTETKSESGDSTRERIDGAVDKIAESERIAQAIIAEILRNVVPSDDEEEDEDKMLPEENREDPDSSIEEDKHKVSQSVEEDLKEERQEQGTTKTEQDDNITEEQPSQTSQEDLTTTTAEADEPQEENGDTSGTKSLKRTLEEDEEEEESAMDADVAVRNKRNMKETSEAEPRRKKFKKLPRTQFDPLAEHRSWCPWVTAAQPISIVDTMEMADTDQSDASSHPSWRRLLNLLVPTKLPQKIKLRKSFETMEPHVSLRNIRRMFNFSKSADNN